LARDAPGRLRPSWQADGAIDVTAPAARTAATTGRLRTPFRETSQAIILLQLAVVAGVLGGWELGARVGLLDPAVISQPTAIVARLAEMVGGADIYDATLIEHVWATVQALAIGYVLGGVLGLVGGLAFARLRLVTRVLQPYVLAVYSIPKIALAPLFVLFFGIGVVSKIAVVALGVFFMFFFNTYAGLVNVDEEHRNIARVMGASPRQLFWRIDLPSAMPAIMTGAKLGVPFAMIGAIVGEFIAATRGLGFLILRSTSLFDTAGLFATILILVAIVWVIGQLVSLLESRLLRWQPNRRQRAVAA